MSDREELLDILPDDAAWLLAYLRYYGYGDLLGAGLRMLRTMLGHDEGWTFAQTVRHLRSAKRCGCKDVPSGTEALRGQWNKKNLTWRLVDPLPTLEVGHQVESLKWALSQWSGACGLTFTQVATGQADIAVSMGRGRADNFDGPGGTLAWFYLPSGNDLPLHGKFDQDERWTIEPKQGAIRHPLVSLHELGHALGLQHDNTPNQVMNPFYNERLTTLQGNDVSRIRALYGAPVAPLPPVPAPASKTIVKFSGGELAVTGPVTVEGYRLTPLAQQ